MTFWTDDPIGLSMKDNYEERKVARFENRLLNLTVSTAQVYDGKKNFETGIKHLDYNNEEWVVVEAYDTKEQAQVGHDKWVRIMLTDPLPPYLEDIRNSTIMGAFYKTNPKFYRLDLSKLKPFG